MNKGISTRFDILKRALDVGCYSIAYKYYQNSDNTPFTTKIEFLENYYKTKYAWRLTAISEKYEYSLIVDCDKKYVSEYVARSISLITDTFEELIKNKISEFYVSNPTKEIGHNG